MRNFKESILPKCDYVEWKKIGNKKYEVISVTPMSDILGKDEVRQPFHEGLHQAADELLALTPEQFREQAEQHRDSVMQDIIHMISELGKDKDDRSVE